MADIIRLLSDTVANQIAAGEVIQRPASAVKELLENAVDSGAQSVGLILIDAGKTLIQVIDDGCGMSDTDARLCFERHATSKLRQIDDLFSLRTMGFRGEALASIASVAQVELKTRQREFEVGYRVEIEGGDLRQHGTAAVQPGTSISVKNLFYNVPARRNFLKSNPVEFRHVQEEFIRVALANPTVQFSLHHNGEQVFDLRPGNYRQRIAAIFGKTYNERLVPVEEDTTIVRLEGYVGKPEAARKNRGEQYFFVNDRFIRDSYLHHAVTAAFDSLIPRDSYASYWLKLTVDPAEIDVNIHPTKTEIKFRHEKDVYAILRAAVKRALGVHSVAPMLDFEREPSFDVPLSKLNQPPVQPTISINPNYNPFRNTGDLASSRGITMPQERMNPTREEVAAWLENHKPLRTDPVFQETAKPLSPLMQWLSIFEEMDDFRFSQIGGDTVVAVHTQGLAVFSIQGARERILYERNLNALVSQPVSSQQQLFPEQIRLNPNDYLLAREIDGDLRSLGFDLVDFGNQTVVAQGIPLGVEPGEVQSTLQYLLEQYRENRDRLHLSAHESLARSTARALVSRKRPVHVSRELRQLAIDLLHCEDPVSGLNGKRIFRTAGTEQLIQFIQNGNLLAEND